MDWSDDAIERLRALWAHGYSTAEIGRRMGVSKNAVVGKAHRIKLEARPSPIKRDPDRTARRRITRRARDATLATLGSLRAEQPDSETGSPAAQPVAVVRDAEVIKVLQATPKAQAFPARPAPASPPTSGKCKWPLWGDRSLPSHQYCCAPAVVPTPYCQDHGDRAFLRRRLNEDAIAATADAFQAAAE